MDTSALRAFGHFLVDPLAHTLLFVGIMLAVSMYASSRKPSIRKYTYLISLSWLFICSQPFFAGSILLPLEDFSPAITESDDKHLKTDALLVMACYLAKDKPLPVVSGWKECSLQRLVQAAVLYQRYKTPIYLTGGDFIGKSANDYTIESKRLLVSLGVNEEHITTIPEGTNTHQELIAASSSLPYGQIGLISSASHMRRLNHFYDNLKKHDAGWRARTPLMIPVDHLVTKPISFSLHMPSPRSLALSKRAFYEYSALLVEGAIY